MMRLSVAVVFINLKIYDMWEEYNTDIYGIRDNCLKWFRNYVESRKKTRTDAIGGSQL